jgi:hypothetical protein
MTREANSLPGHTQAASPRRAPMHSRHTSTCSDTHETQHRIETHKIHLCDAAAQTCSITPSCQRGYSRTFSILDSAQATHACSIMSSESSAPHEPTLSSLGRSYTRKVGASGSRICTKCMSLFHSRTHSHMPPWRLLLSIGISLTLGTCRCCHHSSGSGGVHA